MKKVIGVKAIGGSIIAFFFLIFYTVLGIKLISIPDDEGKYLALSILFFGVVLLCIIIIINNAKSPRKMIEYDEEFLYLNYRKHTEKIKLESIVAAIPRRGRHYYISGWIYIHTNSKEYRIGKVAHCEEVCLQIAKIVKEKQNKGAD